MTTEEIGLPLSSKQRVKSPISQLIPSHIPLHSRPSSPPCIFSFALGSPQPAVWNSYVTTSYSYRCSNTSKADLGFWFLYLNSYWLFHLCAYSQVCMLALSQHSPRCCFGCFSATTTLSFSAALAAKSSCSKHSLTCTLHPVLALVQGSHKAANTPLKTLAPGWLH